MQAATQKTGGDEARRILLVVGIASADRGTVAETLYGRNKNYQIGW
jgi:hypothetical protein